MHYAENAGCRRAELLEYFGEKFPLDNCGACDNCAEPRETYDGTIVAQKFLSCVYRIAQNSRFSVGLNHLIEVLTGADTDKIRRWGHDRLTTYGIGKDLSRTQWAAVGRELHIGEATVKTHLLRAFEKLDVTDRTAAVTAALRAGLIEL